MTSKELRRLSRQDLLELLVRMQQENETLTAKVEELDERLQDRTIRIDSVGSLAEAALVLNAVFTDADKAVAQYKENVQRCYEEQQTAYDKIVKGAEERATEIIRSAEEKAAEIIRSAEEEKQKKMAEADAHSLLLNQLLENYLKSHAELKGLLSGSFTNNE